MSNIDLPIKLNLNPNAKDHVRDNLRTANPTLISATVPLIWGISLKYLSLVILAVQNSTLTIVMHYSRVTTPPSRTYSASTAVLMNEILKGTISLIVAFWRIEPPSPYELAHGSFSPFWSRLRKLSKEVFSVDSWKLSIPAILYVIQNNLQYVAASNLEAATFQVAYQMKILTTAAFSVLLLRKKLSTIQWVSLLFLGIGVGVVQIQAGVNNSSLDTEMSVMNSTKGFLAVVAACFTSGLAGVYFEMVLKNSPCNLWVRNVQLSLFSLLPALAPVILSLHRYPSQNGEYFISSMYNHFGAWAWATVFVQVIGGLVTALVIKYSDNILKGFATSLSIVISFFASVALFDFKITTTFFLGSSIVLVATWLYNQHATRFCTFVVNKEKWSELYWERVNGSSSPRSTTPIYSDTTTSSTSSLSSMTSLVGPVSNLTDSELRTPS